MFVISFQNLCRSIDRQTNRWTDRETKVLIPVSWLYRTTKLHSEWVWKPTNYSAVLLYHSFRQSPCNRHPIAHLWERVIHDDVIKWKHFPRNWPFVWGIHRSPVNSPHKGQWRRALMFTLISTRINDWVNKREAGDLRRNRAHYAVIIMLLCSAVITQFSSKSSQQTPHNSPVRASYRTPFVSTNFMFCPSNCTLYVMSLYIGPDCIWHDTSEPHSKKTNLFLFLTNPGNTYLSGLEGKDWQITPHYRKCVWHWNDN